MRDTSPRRRRRRARIGGELRRSVVLEPSVLAEELRGAGDQGLEGGQPFAMRREDGAVRFRERAANGVGGARRADDRPEIFRRAAPARALEGLERGPDVIETGEGKPPVADLKGRGLRGLGEEGGRRSKPRAPGPETEPPPFRAAFGPERKRAGGRRRTRANRSRRRPGLPGLRRRATLLRQLAEHLLAGLNHLALSLGARLFVVLPLLQLGEDAGFFALSLETPHGVLERLVFLDMDQRHGHSPPYPRDYKEQAYLRDAGPGCQRERGYPQSAEKLRPGPYSRFGFTNRVSAPIMQIVTDSETKDRAKMLETEIERRLAERFAALRDEFDRLRMEADRRWFGFLERFDQDLKGVVPAELVDPGVPRAVGPSRPGSVGIEAARGTRSRGDTGGRAPPVSSTTAAATARARRCSSLAAARSERGRPWDSRRTAPTMTRCDSSRCP